MATYDEQAVQRIAQAAASAAVREYAAQNPGGERLDDGDREAIERIAGEVASEGEQAPLTDEEVSSRSSPGRRVGGNRCRSSPGAPDPPMAA